MAIAVLDIGKTNVKVALFDAAGHRLAERSQPNRALPGPPYLHCDVTGIWDFLLAALTKLGREHRIDVIVPTTHGATAAVVDADPDANDGLVLPVIDYEDPVVDSVEPHYELLRPPFTDTFSPPMGGGLNVGRQLAWLQQAHGRAFGEAAAVLMYPQYWSWRLSGVMVSEVTSLGCHTDLWNPGARDFSSLVDALGLRPLFPPIAGAFDALGTLRPAIAALTGLDPATRVLAGIHDSNASLVPHLLMREPPFTVISTGTWVVLLAIGAGLDRLRPEADMLANVSADGQAVACAKFMGGREFALLTEGGPTLAEPADVAAVIAAGTLALPSFVPEGGPFAHRPGHIQGTLPDRPGARAALATLYTALMTDHLLTRLGADTGPLIVEGGLTKAPAFAATIAALRPDQPMFTALTSTGTAQGAALLAHWPQPAADQWHKVEPLAVEGLASYADAWRAAVH